MSNEGPFTVPQFLVATFYNALVHILFSSECQKRSLAFFQYVNSSPHLAHVKSKATSGGGGVISIGKLGAKSSGNAGHPKATIWGAAVNE